MNKKRFSWIFILILIIGVITGIIIINKKENNNWITDQDFLYDKAVDYIIKQRTEEGYDKDKEDYKVFADYKGFGIEEKNNKKIAYMWIIEESYYVKNNKVESSEGSSTLYKFIFENDEVIDYENPKDGSEYTSSIKKMIPNSLENKIEEFYMEDTKIKEQVKEYYSYLDSKTETNTNVFFYGTVIEVGKAYILVEPEEESIERKGNDKISIGTAEWNIDFKIGDKVKVTYDGTIMESYPAQIGAIDIQLLNETDDSNLFIP